MRNPLPDIIVTLAILTMIFVAVQNWQGVMT